MAVLVRNETTESFISIPPNYGGGVISPGVAIIVNDTLANVKASFGNPNTGYVDFSEVPDGQSGSIDPLPGGGAADTTYSPGVVSNWLSLPANVASALDSLAASGAGGAGNLLGGDLSGNLPSPVIGAAKVTAAKMAVGAAASNVGSLSGDLSGSLPGPVVAAGAITAAKLASGAAASNVGALSGALSGSLPSPSLAASAMGLLQVFTNLARPAANTMAAGQMIWNSTDKAINVSDGVANWYDAVGNLT